LDRGRSIRTEAYGPARVAALLTVLLGGWAAQGGRAAQAAETTRVLTGFDDQKRFDFNVSVAWTHDQKESIVERELEATTARLVNDLIYHQTRDVLRTRIEMGVMRDVGLHVDLPYVLRDDRALDFDRRSAPCLFPGDPGGAPTCVNQNNSTLLRDGILPGAGASRYGVDARSGGTNFGAPASTVFQGPRRSGLEFLGVGVSWAMMNQARDDTRPTLLLGLDAKLDVSSTMRYDAANPSGNTSVGLGYHQLVGSMLTSKRVGQMDPYFGVYYLFPVPSSGSPFDPLPGGSQPHAGPQSRAGAQFGFEWIPWERSEVSQRVTIEVRGRADHRWRGGSRSELWEALSGSTACTATNASACRPGIDLDMNADGVPDRPHPGITETQSYSTVGGDLGLNVQAGRFTRFRGMFGWSSDLSHFITYGTAGGDQNGDGRVNSADTTEANPAYREALDIPGRRFKVTSAHLWTLAVELVAVF
jgi:hypothetical protein